MHRLWREERGVLSIAMVLIIPVIIFGVLFLYKRLDVPHKENAVHKIVYASSEAYLSRYNAYLFEQMGILSNLDMETLEPMIVHYLVENKCVDNRDAVSIQIDYEKMNAPNVFKEAVGEASTGLIGNAMVDYGIDLLDQFTIAEKIKSLNQSVHDYEKKLSEQFDKSGATQIIKSIKACGDAKTGQNALASLKDFLEQQSNLYYKTVDALETEWAHFKTAAETPGQAMVTFLESKEAQWRDTEKAFVNAHQTYLVAIHQMEDQFASIASNEERLEQLADQMETERQKESPDQGVIDQLESLNDAIGEEIDSCFSEVEGVVSGLLASAASSTPSLIGTLKDLLLEAEYIFSGIEIGSAELILEDPYKHSAMHSDSLDTLELPQKIKLNEYFLSIFSSYDVNCPRAFDPQNRHETQRRLKGEVEYLISGLEKEKQSVSVVRLKILGIRSAANLVTLLSDKDKLARLSTATVALPQPWRAIAYGVAIVAWSGVESYSDVNRLMKGEGFYFLKAQSQWALDFDALMNGTWKSKIGGEVSGNPSSNDDILDPNMYYMDYLRLLLLMQDENTTLLRAMDLVEAELQEISEGKTHLLNFSRGHTVNLSWVNFGIEASKLQMRNGFN